MSEINQNFAKPNGKKPRVALLHYTGPPIISGVELVIRDHARLLRNKGYKSYIIVGTGKQFRKDIPVHIIKRMDSRNKFVEQVRSELLRKTLSPTFYGLKKNLYQKLKSYILKEHINVCIVHNVLARHYNLALTAALCELSKDLPHVRFIAWIHDASFSDTKYINIDQSLSKEYPWNLLVTPQPNWEYVCISEFRKNELLKTMQGRKPERLSVIPNGVDIQKFLTFSPPMREFLNKINIFRADLVACTPVRIIKRKNLQLAIKIAEAIVKKGINFKLIITANKDHHQKENIDYFLYLRELVSSLGLENNVFFLSDFLEKTYPGKHVHIDVVEVFEIADFLLMTSITEGFGLPLIEAGLVRVPIFASDIEPFHEIGETNINYFSSLSDPKKIVESILSKLHAMPQAYFYRKVIQKYSLDSIFEKQIEPLILEK